MVLPPAACYPPVGTALPTHLIMEFWYTVHDALVARYGVPPADAADEIIRFRATAEDRTGDMMYHGDPKQIADALAAGYRNRLAAQPPAARTP